MYEIKPKHANATGSRDRYRPYNQPRLGEVNVEITESKVNSREEVGFK